MFDDEIGHASQLHKESARICKTWTQGKLENCSMLWPWWPWPWFLESQIRLRDSGAFSACICCWSFSAAHCAWCRSRRVIRWVHQMSLDLSGLRCCQGLPRRGFLQNGGLWSHWSTVNTYERLASAMGLLHRYDKGNPNPDTCRKLVEQKFASLSSKCS